MNRIFLEDYIKLGNLEFIEWEKFRNKTFLITGATGLIGSNLVNALAYNNFAKDLNLKLILLVRDIHTAYKLFDWTGASFIKYDLGTKLDADDPVDYIVHLASPTSSKFFVDNPVETLLSNIEGYNALLDWSKNKNVIKFLGVSSMEVYGLPQKGHKVKENEVGSFDTINARNSYPISKIACEALCNSYFVQYGIPTVILRATQTFGPGVKYDDNRVFAQFMRCSIEKKDIVLKSQGLTERSYLYTADAVSAILVSLIRASAGQVYSVANPDTYCSIYNMAKMVSDELSDGQINVVFDIDEDIEKLGYSKTLYMDLDVEKIMALGWKPQTNLKDMYIRMIDSFSNCDS